MNIADIFMIQPVAHSRIVSSHLDTVRLQKSLHQLKGKEENKEKGRYIQVIMKRRS